MSTTLLPLDRVTQQGIATLVRPVPTSLANLLNRVSRVPNPGPTSVSLRLTLRPVTLSPPPDSPVKRTKSTGMWELLKSTTGEPKDLLLTNLFALTVSAVTTLFTDSLKMVSRLHFPLTSLVPVCTVLVN